MTSPNVAALADALAAIESPEALYPLAARANAVAATNEAVGVLSMTHVMLMALARTADDALESRQWDALRHVCTTLAMLLRAPDIAALDAVGTAWLDLKRPSALQ